MPDATLPTELLRVVVPSGMLGGLVSGIWRDDGRVTFPEMGQGRLRLGAVADILYGVVGALVIFIILPFTPQQADPQTYTGLLALKIIGVALLGGWGGTSLVDFVFNRTVGRAVQEAKEVASAAVLQVKEVADSAVHQAQQAITVSEKTSSIQNVELLRKQRDEAALALFIKHMNGPPDHPVSEMELRDVLRDTSFGTRSSIFARAKDKRQLLEPLAGKPATSTIVSKIKRLSVVFRALADSAPDDPISFLYYANLGYAQLVIGDYADALANMDRAITIRDEKGEKPYPFFELARARARIRLSENQVHDAAVELVLADIREAWEYDEAREDIKGDDVIHGWFVANGLPWPPQFAEN